MEILKLKRPFDVMVLGMGIDGHFASLFPDMISDKNALNLSSQPEIINTHVKGTPAFKRITMNLSMILESNFCCLILDGDDKINVYKNSIFDKSVPVYYLINQNKIKIHIIKNGIIENEN